MADKVIPRKDARWKDILSNKKVKKTTHRIYPNNIWFDTDCINAKRTVRKLAKAYVKLQLVPKFRKTF